MAVANQKGGVGKTTTAINLAAALAMLGQKTLLADCDPQGNATSGLGFDKYHLTTSIYDGLVGETPGGEIVLATDLDGLFILPSAIALAGAEPELTLLEEGREFRLKRLLAPLRAEYDFILVDCPPSLGLLTLNALTAVDSVIVPIQCEFYALEGVAQLMRTVSLVKESFNPNLELEGILMTMYDGRTNLSVQVEEEVRGHFGEKVYSSVIPRNVRLSEAPSYGQSALQYDPTSKGAEEYLNFAREVLRDEPK
jgi:chromosome partitioning protein